MFISFFVRKSIITHWFAVTVCCFMCVTASIGAVATEKPADDVEELIQAGKN